MPALGGPCNPFLPVHICHRPVNITTDNGVLPTPKNPVFICPCHLPYPLFSLIKRRTWFMEGSVGYALDYILACLRFSRGGGRYPLLQGRRYTNTNTDGTCNTIQINTQKWKSTKRVWHESRIRRLSLCFYIYIYFFLYFSAGGGRRGLLWGDILALNALQDSGLSDRTAGTELNVATSVKWLPVCRSCTWKCFTNSAARIKNGNK